MPFAWFISPYNRRADPVPTRYCAMDDYTAQIIADGGDWSETEVLGGFALVKVRASTTTLAAIAADPAHQRIPGHTVLTDTLGDLTPAQRTAIRNKLNAMGYTSDEITAALPASGNWAAVTLRQLLRFAATRRRKPRYDIPSDTILLDGPEQPTRPIEDVDTQVQ